MTAYTAPVGAPIWLDLMSTDVDASVEFYRSVFGWEAEPANPEFGGYRNFRSGGNVVAGVMAAADASDGPGNAWSCYLRVDNADDALAEVTNAGGQVVVPVTEVGDLGRFGFFVDPAGAAIGVWEPGTHRGFVERGVPGTPYWFDCQSRDYAASTTFYRDAFGWEFDAAGTGGDPDAIGPDRYAISLATFPDGTKDGVAGIMDAEPMFAAGFYPEGTPSFWQIFLTVENTDAAAEAIVAAGGNILRPAEVTPWGTMGAATDSTGAVFMYATPPDGR